MSIIPEGSAYFKYTDYLVVITSPKIVCFPKQYRPILVQVYPEKQIVVNHFND